MECAGCIEKMSHFKLRSVEEILPISGELIISAQEVLQNFRISTSKPLRLFIHGLEKENKFSYSPSPNQFLGLNEFIIDWAKVNNWEWGGCYCLHQPLRSSLKLANHPWEHTLTLATSRQKSFNIFVSKGINSLCIRCHCCLITWDETSCIMN